MEYHVRPMGKTCAATGDPFPPGAAVRSALVADDGRQVRLDFLLSEWAEPPAGTIGHWAARAAEAEPVEDETFDADDLLALLESLGEAGDASNAEQARLRYVLALLLLGEKRLELDSDRETDDGRVLVLLGSGGEGPFEVPDLDLPEDEIGGLEANLPALLRERGGER